MGNDEKILVVSSVPTLGSMLVDGLVQVGVFVLCAVVAYYLCKKAGFDLLKLMRGDHETEQQDKVEPESKSDK